MGPAQGSGATEERARSRPEDRGPASAELAAAIRDAVRNYPDFPRPGILFRDIVPVLGDPALARRITAALADWVRRLGAVRVVGVESRGFLLGMPVALALRLPFVPVRKGGKLPGDTVAIEYELEYGSAHLELQRERIEPGDRVAVIDDLLATGGTAAAAARLVERVDGEVVGLGFLVELSGLDGRRKLDAYNILSLLEI